ncbi:TonB-dependent receptor [Telmatospirillum sp.]|uniref:TonB-dependent receptor n=1 Tax=Telmatospirillum sp. TaxID=2079197 RepID=UPI0028464A24|nr:TonB-dependent receptor [Telmatospirillum sp.]MDR3437653.1 TonB-dependent receptor [Telmatospirillum sp.]
MRSNLLVGVCLSALCAMGIARAEDVHDLSSVETVTVTAPGETRHVQSINDATMQEAGTAASPLQVISQLPSVNFLASDPYGADEFGVRISMRGFNQNQLGFTLDDVPLGDMTYGNWNGLHISRAIINENVGRAAISQGTGALGTASNSNLGGTLQFYSLDPSEKPGVRADQSFGSYNQLRSYARLDSGRLPSGTKVTLSAVYENSDKWKGGGNIAQPLYQVNGKIIQNVGQEGTLSAFLNYSDRTESENESLSHEYINKLGYNWDYIGDWSKSVRSAFAAEADQAYGVRNYPVSAVNSIGGSASNRGSAIYYGGSGLRKDTLGGVTYKTPLANDLDLKTTIYGHRDDGVGLWFAPSAFFNNPVTNQPLLQVNGSPILLRTSEYGLTRDGALSSLTYNTGAHTIEGGFWMEKEYFDLARRLYATSPASPIYDVGEWPTNPWLTQWAYHFNTSVFQVYLQDAYKITDTLTLTAGAKTINTWTTGKLAQWSLASGNYAQGSLYAGDKFLPQIGFNQKIFGRDEIFADVAKNMRAFVAGGPGFTTSPWGTSQANFDNYVKGSIKPETSWSEEIGYRFNHDPTTAEVSVFHTNFSHRLLSASPGGVSIATGAANILTNVGGVTSDGVDVAVTNKLPYHLSWYNGATWNRSTYDKNVVVSGQFYGTKGKITYDTPKYLFKTDLAWHDDGFFAHIGGQYTGKRFYTYTDDNYASAYFITNLGVGYVLDELGPLHESRIQLNVYNLFDKKYVSAFTNADMSDPTGQKADLLLGAPRTIMGSISVKW